MVVHGFPPAAHGGTEVYVHDLAVALAALLHTEVAVLTRHAGFRACFNWNCVVAGLGMVMGFSINNTFKSSVRISRKSHPDLQLAVPSLGGGGGTDGSRLDVVHIQAPDVPVGGPAREIAGRGIFRSCSR